MRKLIEHFFIWTGALLLAVPSARAFSLAGQVGNADDAWQTITLGYGWEDPVAPKDIYEEYRPVVPVIYYASDDSFISYYGASGLTNIDAAFGILNGVMCGLTNTPVFLYSSTNGVTMAANGLPGGVPLTITPSDTLDKYDPNLSDFTLDSLQNNYTAQSLNLLDMKSYILHELLLEIGLADPDRYVWTLHDRFPNPAVEKPKCPEDEEYFVVQRNFDVSPGVNYPYSSYINGNLYSFYITENCGNAPLVPYSAITEPFSADIFSGQYSAVTGGGLVNGGPNEGGFYSALTRDDVMGLRYLLSTNNINWENASAGSQLFTIATNYNTQSFPPSGTVSTNGTGGTNAVGFYYFTGNTNGGYGYGDLGALLAFSTTNDPTTLQAAYPGVSISSYSYNLVWSSNETYTYSYEVPLKSPYGSDPVLTIKTNYIGYWKPYYTYQFANVFTNHIYTNKAQLVKTTIGPPIGSPYGAASVTNATVISTNLLGGDFFVLPSFYTSVCPIDVVDSSHFNVTITTNYLSTSDTNFITSTNTTSISNSVYLVSYFTNYSYLINPVTCTTGTNTANLRRGLGRVQFIRANYDSLLGQFFQPITNNYSMVAISNNQPHLEYYQRVVTAPDFVFQAEDLTIPTPPEFPYGYAAYHPTPQFDTTAIKTQLAGPGSMLPGGDFVFNKTMNNLYLNGSLSEYGMSTNEFLNEGTQGRYIAWASFDASTNYPVIYPTGTDIANVMNQVVISVLPTTVPDGTNGVPYNGGSGATFTASGGQPPLTLSAPNINTLVPGMNFDSSTGQLYGTPTTAGVFTFTIQVVDSANRVVNLNYPITIH